jgi:secondary thiamine-phosphate synthase enzyme
MKTLAVPTRKREEFVELTSIVQNYVNEQSLVSGIVLLYVPHTTAGCTINENADPDVVRDMLSELARFVPYQSDYRHGEGNSDAHIKASLMGSSQLIIVQNGKLVLGRWQGIYFCEFDGPRQRSIHLKTIPDAMNSS